MVGACGLGPVAMCTGHDCTDTKRLEALTDFEMLKKYGQFW
jgi:hypothetical protein